MENLKIEKVHIGESISLMELCEDIKEEDSATLKELKSQLFKLAHKKNYTSLFKKLKKQKSAYLKKLAQNTYYILLFKKLN